MYIHDYACIYNYIYIHNHVYIQLCIEYYLYSTKSNERGWLYRYVCWQLFFTAEQLRNVSAMDDVCALHHVSTSSLLALGYIVMYKYIYMHIYICVCIYIYIVYVLYTTMHGNMYIYIYTQLYIIYTIINRLRNVLADIKWTGRKKK